MGGDQDRPNVDQDVPAVVLGLNPNALGIMRSLSMARIHVVAVGRTPRGWADTHLWMSSRTRSGRKYLLPADASSQDIVAALERLGAKLRGRPPLIPSGDEFLTIIAGERERLSKLFRLSLSPPAALRILLNKGECYGWCAGLGILAPATVRNPDRLDLEMARDGRLRLPLVVKPDLRDSAWKSAYGHEKAVLCRTWEEVFVAAAAAKAARCTFLVQEFVPGPDSNLVFSHAYFAETGELLGLWTGRKIRQYPHRLGSSTMVESVWEPEVAELTARIAERLNLKGYISVEFKRDSRDGGLFLMEVTPNRTWYPHLLGTRLGVNLPALWYQDLMGSRPARQSCGPTPYGLRWIDEYRDLIASTEQWTSQTLKLSDWVVSYRRVRCLALTSLTDPLPGLFLILRLVRSAMNVIGRRLGRRQPPAAAEEQGDSSDAPALISDRPLTIWTTRGQPPHKVDSWRGGDRRGGRDRRAIPRKGQRRRSEWGLSHA
jgi:D-aspartate ligase